MKFLPIPGYPNYRISQDGDVKRQTGPEKFRTVQSTWDNNGHYRIADAAEDLDEELEPSVSELVKRLEEQPDDYFYDLLLSLTETIEQYQP